MIPRSPPTSHTISENRPLRGDPTPHAPHSPVDVGVKHDAQVGAHLAHCLGARLHRGWVLRVRDVVGEGAVRIQEAGAGHVSAQWRQHLHACVWRLRRVQRWRDRRRGRVWQTEDAD
eukprot:366331-Chlamydomonas_euryale.AAC.13